MKQVMFVDDNGPIRDMVSLAFKVEGMEIILCPDGETCLEELKKGFKGVLLIDVNMPEMGGWDVVRAIRDKNLLEGNVICMFTASGDPEDAADDLKDCVLGYFHKPIKMDKLIESTKEYLEFC